MPDAHEAWSARRVINTRGGHNVVYVNNTRQMSVALVQCGLRASHWLALDSPQSRCLPSRSHIHTTWIPTVHPAGKDLSPHFDSQNVHTLPSPPLKKSDVPTCVSCSRCSLPRNLDCCLVRTKFPMISGNKQIWHFENLEQRGIFIFLDSLHHNL